MAGDDDDGDDDDDDEVAGPWWVAYTQSAQHREFPEICCSCAIPHKLPMTSMVDFLLT